MDLGGYCSLSFTIDCKLSFVMMATWLFCLFYGRFGWLVSLTAYLLLLHSTCVYARVFRVYQTQYRSRTPSRLDVRHLKGNDTDAAGPGRNRLLLTSASEMDGTNRHGR